MMAAKETLLPKSPRSMQWYQQLCTPIILANGLSVPTWAALRRYQEDWRYTIGVMKPTGFRIVDFLAD